MSSDVSLDASDLTRFIDAFRLIPDKARREMGITLGKATRDVRERARKHHKFKSRTARLERAIQSDVDKDTLTGRVYIDSHAAPYGRYVHEGTKPHMILPRKRKMLRWVAQGGFAFASKVRHPGTSPDQFLYNAANSLRDKILNDVQATATRIFEEAFK